jgi:hypothetical protein
MTLRNTLLLAALGAALALPSRAMARELRCGPQVLFDATTGLAPGEQGLQFFGLGPVTQTVMLDATTLDTQAAISAQAGYITSTASLTAQPPARLRFTVSISAETHSRDNRAGFSVIALGKDARGIELGFWRDRIWAQEGGALPRLFTQAESAVFQPGQRTTYVLQLDASGYILRANGVALLSGPLRSYAAFDGFPDPYESPGFVFLGDNTSSASAEIALHSVTMNTPCRVFAAMLPGKLPALRSAK